MMPSGSVITLAEPRPTPERRPVSHIRPADASAPAREFDLAAEYDAHGSALFGFAINTLRDRQLAEDCVQETFLRAWRARDRYDGHRATTRTWLFAIARNVIIDVQRSRQRMPRIAAPEVAEDTAADTADPLDRLEVAEAIAKLSDEHRHVLVAVHLSGQSYGEVSAASGVPVATLRTRAFYALRALRAHLDTGEPASRADHDSGERP